ncbi:lysophospholipid acyltransferase family protein [Pleomorphomonas sp. JP5]|uniref:lysophospholipid acyltransferase family protein n=1 Tax=Pleomorphomonas sp. JP5 TaxID=2942998 RepID=UPI002043A3C1|nr:lauroyl acyltransferase [Pleomorphomonas sp. JP5]MCM5556085.1 lauroyl acyltransferase [Pleomorphomonas sp. JP5]
MQAGFWLEYAVLRVVVALLGLLGVDRASAFMGRLWRWFARFNPRHARAERHLTFAMPDLTSVQRTVILLDMWENLGRTFAEGLLLPEIVAHPERIAMSERLAAEIRTIGAGGAVFCSLHQGNWELLAVGSTGLGKPVAGIYRPLRNPLSEAYFRSRRETAYPGGLVSAGTASVLRLRSLARSGVAVAMMADLPDRTGIVASFFGHPAPVSKLPVAMARRLGLPLVVAHCLRTEGAQFRIDGERLDMPHTDDPETDIEKATLALHAVFETWIRHAPGQWMWATRKWPKLELPSSPTE